MKIKNRIITIPKVIKRDIEELVTPAEKVLYQLHTNFANNDFVLDQGMFSNLTIDKWRELKCVLNYLLERYNSNKFRVEFFKNDTNTEILIFENCVIRFFRSSGIYPKRILELANHHPNLESVLDHSSPMASIQYVVSEKLTPLIREDINRQFNRPDLSTSLVDLCDTMYEVLSYLHEHKIQHSDAKLENIGIRDSDGKFVLFDFHCNLIDEMTVDKKVVEFPSGSLEQQDFEDFKESLFHHFTQDKRLILYKEFPQSYIKDKMERIKKKKEAKK